jgi:polyketide biosynthesis acyl carrier protein
MEKKNLFNIIKNNIIEILPDVLPEDITGDKQLRDLGANSIDRVEILSLIIQELKINMPLIELAKVNNLDMLADLLLGKLNL